jgi:hypothetical protein
MYRAAEQQHRSAEKKIRDLETRVQELEKFLRGVHEVLTGPTIVQWPRVASASLARQIDEIVPPPERTA